METARLVRPTIFFGPPRFYNLLFELYSDALHQARANANARLKQPTTTSHSSACASASASAASAGGDAAVAPAAAVGVPAGNAPEIEAKAGSEAERAEEVEAEREALAKLGALMGGRVRIMVCGGGFLRPEVGSLCARAFALERFVHNYGSTESGNITVDGAGSSANAAEVRLRSLPQLGFTVDDKPHPRGEVTVRSKNMFG